MKTSPFYPFFLNMWFMRRCDEAYLDLVVAKGRISKEEKDMIILTPQIEQ